MLSLSDMNKPQFRTSWLLHSLKMHLLVLLGLFTDQIEIIGYPFIYLKPQEGTPFGRSLPAPRIGYYREYPSSPPPPPGSYRESLAPAKGSTFFSFRQSIKLTRLGGAPFSQNNFSLGKRGLCLVSPICPWNTRADFCTTCDVIRLKLFPYGSSQWRPRFDGKTSPNRFETTLEHKIQQR